MQQKAKKDNYCPIYAAREGQPAASLCVSDLEDFMVRCCQSPHSPIWGRTGCIIPPTSGRPDTRQALGAIVVDFTTVQSETNQMRPFIQTYSPHFFRLGDLVQESEK